MTDTFNQLRELRLIAEAELIEAQKQNWPDSRILSLGEVYREWLTEIPPSLEDDLTHWDNTIGKAYGSDDSVTRRIDRAGYAEGYIARHRAGIASNVATVLQFPAFVFYECGKKEDGTYRWRGCRYGLEAHEYLGGFGRV